MSEQKIIRFNAGSEDYWRERREAFALIREAELAVKRTKEAPIYLHGGYDAKGDVIAIENLEPFDDLDEVMKALGANPTAIGILVAQGRTRIGPYRVALPGGVPGIL